MGLRPIQITTLMPKLWKHISYTKTIRDKTWVADRVQVTEWKRKKAPKTAFFLHWLTRFKGPQPFEKNTTINQNSFWLPNIITVMLGNNIFLLKIVEWLIVLGTSKNNCILTFIVDYLNKFKCEKDCVCIYILRILLMWWLRHTIINQF